METLELRQKHPLKGSRAFKLDNAEVHYVINSPLGDDELSVALSVLDVKPEITDSIMAFVSQVNREPLVELFIDKPDKATFDHFVKIMQQRIVEEDFSRLHVTDQGVNVDVARLDKSIGMLKQHVDPSEIESLLSALTILQAKPTDVECQRNVAEAFNELGFVQSQVMTYAPYLSHLLSGNGKPANFLG